MFVRITVTRLTLVFLVSWGVTLLTQCVAADTSVHKSVRFLRSARDIADSEAKYSVAG